jgi:hypothetical protein
MIIVGCDYHPGFQQIAFVDTETGELQERRLGHREEALRRGRKIAKVAMARRLAVRLYWMWRKGWDYEQLKKFGSHAGQPGNRDGVQLNTE